MFTSKGLVPPSTCYHRCQPFPMSWTPDRSVSEARGTLQNLYLQTFLDIMRNHRARRNLLLSIAEVSFKFHCSTCEVTPSTLLVPQAFTGLHSTGPGWYTSVLGTKHILPRTAQHTDAKGSCRSSVQGSSHVPPSVP